ncbi:hypothetical protein [Desulfoscipio gibsoniae]|uniref:Lipoprotein n=1 Tax=Desulfoscipio gibsoniae DSM 7213 TaxID=767817 RepID=R4KGR5_9FIRM|nr:hypothetical protein [Desulfoscipio gibsoniae]AGL02393.1 hypothetical protein Desgi_3008 [Desulfoscipio gibsoniae DSM 7213]
MLKKITVLLAIAIILTACSSKQNYVLNVSNEDESLINNISNALYNDYYKSIGINLNNIEVCDINPYLSGRIVVSLVKGEGARLDLFYLAKDNDNKYKADKKAEGEMALSMGFSVNRIADYNNTIIFGNLNETTWLPDSDKKIKTDFEKVSMVLDNDEIIEEDIKGDKAYIIIINKSTNIHNIKFFNSDNKVVCTLNDLIKYGSGINNTKLEQIQ